MITATRRTPPKGRPGTRPSRRVPPPQRSFLDRNRVRLLWAGVVAVALVASGLVYVSFTQKGYACLSEWTAPSPAPTAAPGASQLPGLFEDDMGRGHVPVGTRVKYTFCPPASGQHYSATGAGPIQPKLYSPNDATVPQNWVHNMEHGGLVLLYRCTGSDTGCGDADQAAFRDFVSTFPDSPICHIPKGLISPVVARFDDMAYPYAALVWDYVLPLTKFDAEAVIQFFKDRAETVNPEPQCSPATPSPGPSGSPAPSAAPTAAPSTQPSTGASPTPAGT